MGGIVRAIELGAEQEKRAQAAEENLSAMEELAMRDSLTGLYTRRALEQTYKGLQTAKERERASDAKSDDKASRHSMLLIDIDHFKSVNDTLGHDVGDNVLEHVANSIKTRRQRDVPTRLSDDDSGHATRWGGEEMALLLPRANEQDAVKVAEEIRRSIEEDGEVTVSIGVVELELDQSLKTNVALADKALYTAKEAGRNQVVAYSSLPTTGIAA
jgi:diguanylate cyclase (GGDEF)-like protein